MRTVKYASTEGVVEDCDTDSDDENDEAGRVVTKDEDIPESNYILMEKPKIKQVISLPDGPNVHFMYKLKGSDKMISNDEFPIKDVDPDQVENVLKSIIMKMRNQRKTTHQQHHL